MIYLCTTGLKSKPEETTILRSRSVIFVSRWGWHEGSTNCSVLQTDPFRCSEKGYKSLLKKWQKQDDDIKDRLESIDEKVEKAHKLLLDLCIMYFTLLTGL